MCAMRNVIRCNKPTIISIALLARNAAEVTQISGQIVLSFHLASCRSIEAREMCRSCLTIDHLHLSRVLGLAEKANARLRMRVRR